jgi:hypothetical protein
MIFYYTKLQSQSGARHCVPSVVLRAALSSHEGRDATQSTRRALTPTPRSRNPNQAAVDTLVVQTSCWLGVCELQRNPNHLQSLAALARATQQTGHPARAQQIWQDLVQRAEALSTPDDLPAFREARQALQATA